MRVIYLLSGTLAAVVIAGAGYWYGARVSSPALPAAETVTKTDTVNSPPKTTTGPAIIGTEKVSEFKDRETDFRRALESGEYDQALEIYNKAYRGSDLTRIGVLRQELLQFASRQMDQKQHQRAQELLNKYIRIFYQDVAALSLNALSYHQSGRHGQEVELLLQALQYVVRSEDRQSLDQRLEFAVKEHGQRLARNNGYPTAINFYQSLIDREPGRAAYRIALARIYLYQHEPQNVLDLLANVYSQKDMPTINALRDKATELLAARESARNAVPLDQSGLGPIVRAVVNDGYELSLLIDTGASMVTLRPETVERLGLQTKGVRRFSTANGVVNAPIVHIRELKVGEHTIKQLPAGVMALPGHDFDGLLGMNFLSQFRFTIDQQRNTLLLQLREQ